MQIILAVADRQIAFWQEIKIKALAALARGNKRGILLEMPKTETTEDKGK